MGAHKQRWTAEEETALKAGVVKHGMGKWRTILTDPDFSSLLRFRSNVDLKDKWRNINVTANGWGSRHRAKIALKKCPTTPQRDDNLMALSAVPGSVEEVVDAKPLPVSRGTPRAAGSKEPNKRLDSLILETLTSLKEPGGSDKHAIAMYIEEQYWAPPNLKKLISTKLKLMSANGKLIKLKRKYRIAPNSTASEVRSSSSLVPLEERKKKKSLKPEKSTAGSLAKSQIDVELSKSRSMSALEAAEAAARAVAEAEAAIAVAEEAARVAEAAEAEAEAAQIFAEAAMKALECTTVQT